MMLLRRFTAIRHAFLYRRGMAIQSGGHDYLLESDSKNAFFQKIAALGNGVFPLRSSDCKTIANPTEFYEIILENIEKARSTITLTSLYIGTGEKEQGLVDALRRACERSPHLRVRIVLDHSRGTRGGKDSSASLLTPLRDALGDRLTVGFFLMPQL